MTSTCRLLHGHVLDLLRTLLDRSVQCVVTSPPYWGLRDYGVPPIVWGGEASCPHEWGVGIQRAGPAGAQGATSQRTGRCNVDAQRRRDDHLGAFCIHCDAWRGSLGLEPTHGLYVAHLVEVFREVRRVLRDDGTLWLVIGDTYATGGGKVGECPGGGEQGERWKGNRGTHTAANGGKHGPSLAAMGPRTQPNRMPLPGLKPKDLCMIPARVAMALQADGWYLRSQIPWLKRNGMPSSVTDRPGVSHETIFLLSKSESYFYDRHAILKPHTFNRWGKSRHDNASVVAGVQMQVGTSSVLRAGSPDWFPEGGRNRRTADWFFESILVADGVIVSGLGEILGLNIPTESFNGAEFLADFLDAEGNPRRRNSACPQHGESPGPLFCLPHANQACACEVVTVGHFAAYPPALVEPLIKACTSEQGCCAECGAPRMRLVESRAGTDGRNLLGPRERNRGGRTDGLTKPPSGLIPTSRLIRWRPTCDHQAESVPAVVLDPFAGAGSTGVSCVALGRSFIGIDLNGDYCAMAQRRIEATA